MDHISKALERAQSERKSVRSWVRPDQSERIDNHPAGTDLGGNPVELDLDALRANHVLCGPTIDDPAVTDKYRLLRTRILQLMQPRGWTRLGVTSPGPKAGKTLNAINLSISIARDGNHHVYLIDADLRRPSVARTLGLEADLGIIDHLTSDVALSDIALEPTGLPNISIIPGRHSEADAEAPERLSSRKMSRLLSDIGNSEKSSVVIVDLPPVLIGDDVIALAPSLDAMLLVIDEGGTDLEELKGTAELLADFNLIGTILNKSTERSKEASGYYQAYHG